jgi:putative copper export protein
MGGRARSTRWGKFLTAEQSLGLAVLAVVSVLGTWPPALYAD